MEVLAIVGLLVNPVAAQADQTKSFECPPIGQMRDKKPDDQESGAAAALRNPNLSANDRQELEIFLAVDRSVKAASEEMELISGLISCMRKELEGLLDKFEDGTRMHYRSKH